jgi:hypothetical protein
MVKISHKLDRIATQLELRGLKKLATSIDVVSNSLEVSAETAKDNHILEAVSEKINELPQQELHEAEDQAKQLIEKAQGDPEKLKSILKSEFGSQESLMKELESYVSESAGSSEHQALQISMQPRKLIAGALLLGLLGAGLTTSLSKDVDHLKRNLHGTEMVTPQEAEKDAVGAALKRLIKVEDFKVAVEQSESVEDLVPKIGDTVRDFLTDNKNRNLLHELGSERFLNELAERALRDSLR